MGIFCGGVANPRFQLPCQQCDGDWFRPTLHSGWPHYHSRRTKSEHPHRLANGSRRACPASDYSLPSGGFHMIKEHECVVLTVDLPAEGLAAGDIGTVVHVHKGGEGYEI